jgi:hypothetical protein
MVLLTIERKKIIDTIPDDCHVPGIAASTPFHSKQLLHNENFSQEK